MPDTTSATGHKSNEQKRQNSCFHRAYILAQIYSVEVAKCYGDKDSKERRGQVNAMLSELVWENFMKKVHISKDLKEVEKETI